MLPDWRVEVDERRCAAVAKVLQALDLPTPIEEEVDLGVPFDVLPDFYFFVVAICHQTSPRGLRPLQGKVSPGVHKLGWDYLRLRLAERAREGVPIWSAVWWRGATGDDLERLLADGNGDGVISQPERRASLVRNLGQRFEELGVGSVADLHKRAGGRILELSDLLRTFEAYSDPVEKKSFFLLQLLRSECNWRYEDVENLGPPVDYHEVRGHLRLGTVKIIDDALRGKVEHGEIVEENDDVVIRGAVRKAIERIALDVRKTDPATLHYLFWNWFRACCAREQTHCYACPPDCKLPSHYRRAQRCVLSEVCAGRDEPHKLIEHQAETEYY